MIRKGSVVERRIDLLDAETDFLTAALPHELTHVVLSDKFGSNPMPRWAEEGIAILADPAAKQARHRNDLKVAVSNGTVFSTALLFAMGNYPQRDRFGAFYGQSASLTEYLVRRRNPAQFVTFIQRAQLEGYDSALQQCYEISSMGELDRLWRKYLVFANSLHTDG